MNKALREVLALFAYIRAHSVFLRCKKEYVILVYYQAKMAGNVNHF